MRTIGIGLVLLAFAAPAAAQTFVDDFSSGTDANWTRADLLAAGGLGPTIYDASTGAYAISSAAALPPLPLIVASGSFWSDSLAQPMHYDDGAVRATVRSGNADTNLAIAARFAASADSGYFFFLDVCDGVNECGIGISSLVAGAGSFVNLAVAPLALDPGVDYLAEATFSGDDLTFKVWPANGPEPLLPQLAVTNSDHDSGALGLAVYNQPEWAGGSGGRLAGVFDDVRIAVPEPTGGLMLLLSLALALGTGRR